MFPLYIKNENGAVGAFPTVFVFKNKKTLPLMLLLPTIKIPIKAEYIAHAFFTGESLYLFERYLCVLEKKKLEPWCYSTTFRFFDEYFYPKLLHYFR
jgi:hypothetical protein